MSAQPRIVIHMEGGVIQDIAANGDIEIMVIDYDTDGQAAAGLTQVDRGDHYSPKSGYVFIEGASVEPEYVDGRFARFAATNGKEA